MTFAAVWFLSPDDSAELQALRAQIEEIEGSVAGLPGGEDAVAALTSRIETLEQAAPPGISEELQARLDALQQASPGALNEELQARLEALEQGGPDLAGLTERIDQLEAALASGAAPSGNQEQLEQLREELAALSAEVAARALGEGDATASDLAVIETLQSRLAALEASQPAGDGGAALGALQERLEALEASLPEAGAADEVAAQLAELAGRLDAVEPLGEQTAGAQEQLTALSGQLRGLEEQIQGQGERADASRAELQMLRARLTELEERIAAADRRRERGALLALATSQVDSALAEAEAYEAPLEALQALAADDETVREAVAALEPAARTGVPSLAELRRSFEEVAGEVVHEARAPEGEGLLDRAAGNLMRLVSVRPVGAEAEGDEPPARVARAEAALAAGDLAAAVAEVEALEGPAATAAADWLAAARTRLEAMRALERLRGRATELLAQSG